MGIFSNFINGLYKSFSGKDYLREIYQCEKCAKLYQNCCSKQCKEINDLPLQDQKKLRKGKGNSNKIFKKGRSKVLKFKKIS